MPASPKILILGAGGFIGSHLLERILTTTDRQVIGIDIQSSKIEHLLDSERLTFAQLNVHDTRAVTEYIEQADIVISLVALCNPALYNTIPLDVIDINFNRPYELVKVCARMGKWLIHFSTSEIYGRTIASYTGLSYEEQEPKNYLLNEDETPLVLGPISNQRWSYACAKQLLERVLYAFAFEKGLQYSVIRPFNFIGPRMDFIPGVDGEGTPRVLACFMEALLFHKPIRLVDGGLNRRVFTYIDDAVDALMCMLRHPDQAKGHAFNVGNVANEISIADLARKMVATYKDLRPEFSECDFEINVVSGKAFYGEGYEDSDRRVPDIAKARELIGWEPKTGLDRALRNTMRAYIEQYASAAACRKAC
ncbi:MAG: bifunctional UDP-4-keto-pentose/UDP-xylose synthase [Chitinivibrionales bacterium]|nr:bifunctional UDP-4-keto-pentose/UDP-xylose synthase [Chitinivibrionales bacterium]